MITSSLSMIFCAISISRMALHSFGQFIVCVVASRPEKIGKKLNYLKRTVIVPVTFNTAAHG